MVTDGRLEDGRSQMPRWFLILTVVLGLIPASGALSENDEAIDALLANLGSEDFTARENAERALLDRGPEILPAVERILETTRSPEIQFRCLRILETLREGHKLEIEEDLQLSDEQRARFKTYVDRLERRAAEGEAPTPDEAWSHLRDTILNDRQRTLLDSCGVRESSDGRCRSSRCLMHGTIRRRVILLIEMLSSENEESRHFAEQGLIEMGQDAMPEIRRALAAAERLKTIASRIENED